MGRRKVNPTDKESLQRIIHTFQNVESLRKAFWPFYIRWETAGHPNIFEERFITYDQINNRNVYYGMFYDLQEIFNNLNLVWPVDIPYVMKLLKTLGNKNTQTPKLPQVYYWKWFRMAETGLQMPTSEEIKFRNLITPHGKNRKLYKGLIIDEIIQFESTTNNTDFSERTISNGINSCWDYLIKGGNVEYAFNCTGLNNSKYLEFLLKILF